MGEGKFGKWSQDVSERRQGWRFLSAGEDWNKRVEMC